MKVDLLSTYLIIYPLLIFNYMLSLAYIRLILTYRPGMYSCGDSQRSWPMRPIANVGDLMFDTLLWSSRNRNWARVLIGSRSTSIVDELL